MKTLSKKLVEQYISTSSQSAHTVTCTVTNLKACTVYQQLLAWRNFDLSHYGSEIDKIYFPDFLPFCIPRVFSLVAFSSSESIKNYMSRKFLQ